MLPINKKLFDIIRCKMMKKMKYMNYENRKKIQVYVERLNIGYILHTTNTGENDDLQDDIVVKHLL